MVAFALLALALTMQILFYTAPLRKTYLNYRKHKTSLHVSSQIPCSPVHPVHTLL